MKMKTKITCWQGVIAAVLTGSIGMADSACCEVEAEPEVPACCVEPMPSLAAELPAESIYQLDFTFIDDSGASRHLTELRGQPVLMAMFFAQCGYACPLLVRDMKSVIAGLPADVAKDLRVLMVTFDTGRDSVDALRTYRETNDLDERWVLLRASPADTRTFAMVVGVQYRQEPSGDYSHSNLITLLDQDGVIAHRRSGLQGGLDGLGEATVRFAEMTP
jgi:protein SCO1